MPSSHPLTDILKPLSLAALTSIIYLGAFSRFTDGRFTPSFYAYQLDRAPNDGYARLIPVADTVLATLLIFDKSRWWTSLFCCVAQGGAIVGRLREGKAVVLDCAMFSTAAVVLWTSWAGRAT